jgi:hypothetical protein
MTIFFLTTVVIEHTLLGISNIQSFWNVEDKVFNRIVAYISFIYSSCILMFTNICNHTVVKATDNVNSCIFSNL